MKKMKINCAIPRQKCLFLTIVVGVVFMTTMITFGLGTGYKRCAAENGSVNCGSPCDLAYGANGNYYFLYNKTGPITFNNQTFGDPAPNVAKSGYCKPAKYTWCANENGSVDLPAIYTAAYGANGKYYYKYNVSGPITFNNQTFGDPAPNVAKFGYYKLNPPANSTDPGGSFPFPEDQ